MMPLWRPGTPHGGDLSGHDEYAMWDAAYVLGSLSSAEQREFEAHLAGCPLCRSAVGELNGMPALLSLLDRDELAAIDEALRAIPRHPCPRRRRRACRFSRWRRSGRTGWPRRSRSAASSGERSSR